MHKSATVQAAAPIPLVFGDQAKNLLMSVMRLVPVHAAVDVLQEIAELNAQTDTLLGLASIRGTLAKAAIATANGPSISTAIAANRLRRSAETIRNMIERDELVGFCPIDDRTKLLLPVWQFTPRGGAHPWVPELIKAYGANGWGLMNFIAAPRDTLDGASYLHLLQNGSVAEVLKAAKRTNPD